MCYLPSRALLDGCFGFASTFAVQIHFCSHYFRSRVGYFYPAAPSGSHLRKVCLREASTSVRLLSSGPGVDSRPKTPEDQPDNYPPCKGKVDKDTFDNLVPTSIWCRDTALELVWSAGLVFNGN